MVACIFEHFAGFVGYWTEFDCISLNYRLKHWKRAANEKLAFKMYHSHPHKFERTYIGTLNVDASETRFNMKEKCRQL